MADAINFGKRVIEALPIPGEGRARYRDTGTRFLYLDVYASGRKTFLYVRKIEGKVKFMKIGDYPALTPTLAKDTAEKRSQELAGGKTLENIKAESRRGGDTFGEIFEQYFEEYLKKKTRLWKESERVNNVYLKPLHKMAFLGIMPSDVKRLHSKLTTERGTFMANRAIRLVRSTYNWAIKEGRFILNPAARLTFNKEPHRKRFLQKIELPKFFQALDTLDPDWQDFFRLALFTGARKSNLQAAKWADINLEGKIWTIPAAEFKTNEETVIELTDEACEILIRRLEKSESKYVFPSRFLKVKKTKCEHITEPKGAWKRLLEKAGLKNLRIHDLRRTLGSYENMTGANLAIIGKTLGHKPGSTATAVYAGQDQETVRGALEKATAAILAAATKKENDNEKK
jgi:integrase